MKKCNSRENQQSQSLFLEYSNKSTSRKTDTFKTFIKINIRIFKVNSIAGPEIKTEWWVGRCLLYQALGFFLLEIFHSLKY